MTEFVEVARPLEPRNLRVSKYGHIYEALERTVITGQAIKFSGLDRGQKVSIQTYFKATHPGLRVCMRTLPDGIYMWAVSTNGKVIAP